MKRLLFAISMMIAATVTFGANKVERPKLVVGLVVDQMRWDYLYYYYEDFGEGGLKRLVDEGFSCENTMINYIPTITAIGHTSVFTGSVPALHGIAGNNFMEKGKDVYCCADSTVQGVGTDTKAGRMSPRNNKATTIGDELRLATDFKSRVFGVALKDRAAIFPAGHSANAAYWYDNAVGHFVTSTYYMDKLPKWMEQYNKENTTKKGEDQKGKPEGVTITFKMAEAVLRNERLGMGDYPDMLTISISSTDVIGHAYGTRDEHTKAAYMQLDKELAKFLRLLDNRYGKNGYLLFLTADHGGAHNPNYLKQHHIYANGWPASQWVKDINAELSKRYGVNKLVTAHYGDFFYLNHAKIDSAGLNIDEVKQAVINQLLQEDELLYAVDCAKASTATVPQIIRERIINGYNTKRSGDIVVIPRSQMFSWQFKDDYKGTTHGQWNPYDAHIPLVFLGWHVTHGSTSKPTYIVDIAATVCAMLHIEMPNSCIGNAIVPVVNQGQNQ
ncbi:MAG: alkaline phosphatase family protein [Prevotella sp.]|nr:alkaline phosphatase family protein [Prevotella sp.]